ncbi:MAG TPA: 3-deoxy-manno-octulosonate cytidylyltransferase [Polyangiaceae bacterium]|nr:3-deoxy-manno-octulosonate cytidylyltransferase [Polyangiaceae bacterium]
MFEQVAASIKERARRVRLLALDVDGVLTDGGLVYTADGESSKRFHVRDGLGLRLLREQGYVVAVVSARAGAPLERRLRELGVGAAVLGTHDKLTALTKLTDDLGIPLSECAFVGDDLWDLPALRAVGFAVTVADGHPLVQREATYVTEAPGGRGAVREVADLLLASAGKLEAATRELLAGSSAVEGFGVVIPARYGATRLPGKPLLPIAGKPMVLHVCDNARESGASSVLVATDDERIERVVREAGVDVMLTAIHHRSGTDRLAEVVQRRQIDPGSIIVNVQGDEPLLAAPLIRAAAEALRVHPRAGIATLAAPIERFEDWTNPNIVKVVTNQAGFAEYFSRAPIPFVRDAAPAGTSGELPTPLAALRHIGVYAYRTRALLEVAAHPPVMQEQCESLEQLRALWLGIPIHVSVVEEMPAHGVDTADDLRRVEELLKKRGHAA